MNSYEIAVWILLSLLLVVLFYIIHKRFKERNVWANLVKQHKDSIEKKLNLEASFVSKFGSIENKSLLYKMDRLILTSGIKRVLP